MCPGKRRGPGNSLPPYTGLCIYTCCAAGVAVNALALERDERDGVQRDWWIEWGMRGKNGRKKRRAVYKIFVLQRVNAPVLDTGSTAHTLWGFPF